MAGHPMDAIEVRQLRFETGALEGAETVWSRSCPDFSMFINALGVHVPHFERFLVSVMREYRGGLQDERLLADVQAIIGQEAQHAFNFLNWTAVLGRKYPGILPLDTEARRYFAKALGKGKRFKIGFTAGYETFTFLGGMIILGRFDELMGDADPRLRALWVWHQVEEVEHGSVAFDFYQAFYGQDEWYRKWMVLRAFSHIARQTFLAFRQIVKGEGFGLARRAKAWRFFVSFAWDLFRASLPVFRAGYHPRRHPICNDQQNEIAVAWRGYYASGANALALTDAAMNLLKKGGAK